jgi:hypothetical protein
MWKPEHNIPENLKTVTYACKDGIADKSNPVDAVINATGDISVDYEVIKTWINKECLICGGTGLTHTEEGNGNVTQHICTCALTRLFTNFSEEVQKEINYRRNNSKIIMERMRIAIKEMEQEKTDQMISILLKLGNFMDEKELNADWKIKPKSLQLKEIHENFKNEFLIFEKNKPIVINFAFAKKEDRADVINKFRQRREQNA